MECGRFEWERTVLQLYGLMEAEISTVAITAFERDAISEAVTLRLVKARLKKAESLKRQNMLENKADMCNLTRKILLSPSYP